MPRNASAKITPEVGYTPKEAFRSAYNFRQVQMQDGSDLPFSYEYKTEPGRPMQNEYAYKINSYGQKILEKTGEKNLYAEIQAALEETKIENILARVANGDMSDFRPNGIFADTTEIPSNLIEARQAMQELENTWNKLPNDTKRKYDFDVEKFIGQSGSESWLRDMGLLPAQAEAVAEAVADTTVEVKGDSNE